MAQIDIDFIELLPIKVPDSEMQAQMAKIVNSIYEVTSNAEWSPKSIPTEQAELQSKLDVLVFDLYGLSTEERQLVQDAVK
jgi:restriction endonuclease S subunit